MGGNKWEKEKQVKKIGEFRIQPKQYERQRNLLQIMTDCNEIILEWCVEWSMSLSALVEGRQVNSHVIISIFSSILFIRNNFVNKCERIDDAHNFFDRIPRREEITWTPIVTGHAQNGPTEKVVNLFAKIQRTRMRLNEFTFAVWSRQSLGLRKQKREKNSCLYSKDNI